jgi:hypothetical protein
LQNANDVASIKICQSSDGSVDAELLRFTSSPSRGFPAMQTVAWIYRRSEGRRRLLGTSWQLLGVIDAQTCMARNPKAANFHFTAAKTSSTESASLELHSAGRVHYRSRSRRKQFCELFLTELCIIMSISAAHKARDSFVLTVNPRHRPR